MGRREQKILTETESYEKRYEIRPREKWKVGKIGRETDTGLLKRSEMESDKEKRRNVVCATAADASQVMIVLSSNRRYTHTHTLARTRAF